MRRADALGVKPHSWVKKILPYTHLLSLLSYEHGIHADLNTNSSVLAFYSKESKHLNKYHLTMAKYQILDFYIYLGKRKGIRGLVIR